MLVGFVESFPKCKIISAYPCENLQENNATARNTENNGHTAVLFQVLHLCSSFMLCPVAQVTFLPNHGTCVKKKHLLSNEMHMPGTQPHTLRFVFQNAVNYLLKKQQQTHVTFFREARVHVQWETRFPLKGVEPNVSISERQFATLLWPLQNV